MRVLNYRIESLFLPSRYTERRDLCNCFRRQLRSIRAVCGDQVQLSFVGSLFFFVTWYPGLNGLSDILKFGFEDIYRKCLFG